MPCAQAATHLSFTHSLEIFMDNSSFPSSDRSTGSGQGGSTYSSTAAEPGGLGMGSTGSMGGSGGMGSSHARETVDRAKDSAHSTVDRLASTARDWAGRLDERTQGLTDMPTRALDYSRHTVQERPVQAILLAMLVGYVIGRFSGGRSTHHVEY
jgi:ElaB/YqjD/DUF883 family membrane-anchored ribosome-binding protein